MPSGPTDWGEEMAGAARGERTPNDADEQLCAAARRVLEEVRTTRAPGEVLDEARRQLERVIDVLAPHAHEGGFAQADREGGLGLYGQSRDPMALFPYSPLIGRLNPVAPPVEFWMDGDVVRGRAVFRSPYCGPPNHVHGGVVAGVLDELLGVVNVMHGRGAMTGTLTIKYRAPTPLFEEIRMLGCPAGVDGRKVYAEGSLWHGETLLAEAEGVFILIGEEARSKLGIASDSGLPRRGSEG
jgi:acyl-coenzyme A thioesterase PaaI-like protein